GLQDECGLGLRLREAWDRYSLPTAVTEVHHGCTREQQLRWLAEAWRTAEDVRGQGVELEAVTFWSAVGAVDWRSLITREDHVYDVGAMDVRGPVPRPTALARAAAALGAGQEYDHPVLSTEGWWRRPERFYEWCRSEAHPPPFEGQPILITGGTGTLGQAFARIAAHRGLAHRLTLRAELDICDPESIAAAIRRIRPWAIVNAAGYVR